LNLGRGYIAKSGQTTMVQVGSPFHRPDQKHHSIEISDLQRGDALDSWVNKIANLYDEQATWSAQPEESTSTSSGPAVDSPEYQRVQRSINALRKYMLSEVEYLKQHNGTRSLILERFIALESSDWHNPTTLSQLLRETYVAQQAAIGMDAEST